MESWPIWPLVNSSVLLAALLVSFGVERRRRRESTHRVIADGIVAVCDKVSTKLDSTRLLFERYFSREGHLKTDRLRLGSECANVVESAMTDALECHTLLDALPAPRGRDIQNRFVTLVARCSELTREDSRQQLSDDIRFRPDVLGLLDTLQRDFKSLANDARFQSARFKSLVKASRRGES